MNIKQLECYVEVARVGNITHAAKNLYLSQSSLTYQIQQLEKEVGAPLFSRTAKGMVLTSAGAVLNDAAVRCIDIVDKAVAQAREIEKSGSLAVSIGHGCMDTDPYFADGLAMLESKFPSIQINLESGHFRRMFEAFQNHGIDLLIGLRREIEHEARTKAERIANTRLRELFLASRTCVVKRDDNVPKAFYLSDLRDYTLIFPENHIMPDRSAWTRDFGDGRVLRPKNLDTALAYAAAGAGVLVLPQPLISLPENLVQIPLTFGPSTSCILLWHSGAAIDHADEVARALVAWYEHARA